MSRDKGTGSIYQRKSDGRWFAQLTVNGQTRTKSDMDQAIVKRWLKETLKESHQGIFVVGKTPTVKEYFSEWMAGRDVQARTRISYECSLKRIIGFIGHVPLDRVTENQIRAMWQSLAAGKGPKGKAQKALAATTLQTTYTHLNSAFADAVRSKNVPLQYNPVPAAKPPKARHREMHPLTEQEVRNLLEVTKGDSEYAIWLTLITCGLRIGELVGLKLADVSLDRAALTIRRGVYRLTGKGMVEADTKTGKGRLVDMPMTTVTALREHLARQKVRKMRHRMLWAEHDYVFTTDTGAAIDPRLLNRKFTLALERAGLEDRKLHNTRHTFATIHFAHDVHPKVVQEQLGHSSIKITLDTYSAYIPSMGRDAAEKMDALFG